MRFPSFVSRSLLLGTCLLASALSAQQQIEPLTGLPLEGILMRLQIRYWHYIAHVPNFFCDERVLSKIDSWPPYHTSTVTDSIFRLKRSEPDVIAAPFSETREIKSVDNHPPLTQTLSGPSIFSGGFSSALGIITLHSMHCFDLHLIEGKRLHRKPVILIDYALKPSAITDETCPGPDTLSGHVYIDPQTFRLLRLEMRIPDHQLLPDTRGLWTWSIDYAPINLDGQIFWMPQTIASHATSSNKLTDWDFVASYRNYHRMYVTSRILENIPSETTNQPNQP